MSDISNIYIQKCVSYIFHDKNTQSFYNNRFQAFNICEINSFPALSTGDISYGKLQQQYALVRERKGLYSFSFSIYNS